MIVQQREPAAALNPDRDPKLVVSAINVARGVKQPQSVAAPASVGSNEPGVAHPPTPPQSAGSNDQNRGLVPEGEAQSQAPQSAQAQPAEQQSPEGADDSAPPEGSTGKTQRKWKRVLEKTKEKDETIAALQARLAALESQGRQPAQPQAQPAPQRKAIAEFSKPFPEDGTHEDQMIWKAEKAGFDAAQKVFAEQLPQQLGESFRNFATVIEPALQHSLGQMVNGQWEALRPNLEATGVSVEEIRPLVEEEAAKHGLDIPSALGRVLFHRNFSEHWQEDAPAPAPPKAPARPAGPARAVTGRFQPVQGAEDPVEKARELKRSGQKPQAESVMAAYLKTLARR